MDQLPAEVTGSESQKQAHAQVKSNGICDDGLQILTTVSPELAVLMAIEAAPE